MKVENQTEAVDQLTQGAADEHQLANNKWRLKGAEEEEQIARRHQLKLEDHHHQGRAIAKVAQIGPEDITTTATTMKPPKPSTTTTTTTTKSTATTTATETATATATQPEKAEQSQQQEVGLATRLAVGCLLCLIRALVATYDLISQPIYYFKHEVNKRRQRVEQLRSLKLDPNDPNSPWRQVDIEPRQVEVERQIDSFETYDEMMLSSFRSNGPAPCYGYRQVLEEHFKRRPDSDKLLRQVKLSDFKWCTYEQFDKQIEAARKGFLLEGARAGDKVMLYADTRPEWQIVSQALIRLGAVVCTMYSTLGVDGILHTVNETQVSHVVAQRDKVSRLLRLKGKLPKLKKIIYFETSLWLPLELGGDGVGPQRGKVSDQGAEFRHPEVECICFRRLLEEGLAIKPDQLERLEAENLARPGSAPRSKDSPAVIMYTSGSTGIPKGVLISHGNIMATIKSFSYVTKDFVHKPKENVCTAYLPLAHIFEFCIESVMLFHGVRYGFATPHTLTDKSPGLAPGQLGDLTLLRPTIMIIVPLILDRVVQGIKQTLKAGSYLKKRLVSYLIDYKSYWQRRHYETPLVDRIVCRKIAVALGGRARWVICGSAPLSAQTQTFVRAALDLKLPQGFGTTETCAATACQLFDDQSTENVGLPVAGAKIKLEPWLEGNYRPSDKPNPRGEIVVGGEMIAHGYFNLEEQTKEAFYVDSEGTRWYRTGDIGEFLPNGQLKIIDRKKDLVKLQNGEYVSLGRVESILKSNPYTENFCVYANSNHNYVVALGPANELAIRGLAQQIVDEHERRLSPSMAKRFGGSVGGGLDQDQDQDEERQQRHQQQQQLSRRLEERERLLMSEDEKLAAVEELKEVLASYESDRLNNNTNGGELGDLERQVANGERKMSALSTCSSLGAGPPPPSSCTNERLGRLCDNWLVRDRVHCHLSKMARERNLLSLEVPRRLLLLAEEWTEDKNLVTAAMKIRRNFIYKRYAQELGQLYAVEAAG